MDTPLGSVLYITLGCAKNEVDTDRMRSLLTAAGYEEAFDPQDADIAIVNTCSFLASATSESIETTLELANEVQDGVRSCPIVMCGCVPSRYGDDLPDELPEVAAFVKADEEDGIVAVIDGVLGVEREIAAYIPQVKRTVEGAVAYVKISDGCNRFCSFCMIPYIRGRYHSRNSESIISEVRDLVAGGVREIVLIGREAGSGTRDGFESITGTKDACKLDQELTSTGGVIEAVSGNPNAIGYASLSAVEGKAAVKALTVNGVACTEATVLDGSYQIQRPFVLVTKEGVTLSAAAQAFFDFATSAAASDLIKNAGAVPVAK